MHRKSDVKQESFVYTTRLYPETFLSGEIPKFSAKNQLRTSILAICHLGKAKLNIGSPMTRWSPCRTQCKMQNRP